MVEVTMVKNMASQSYRTLCVNDDWAVFGDKG